MLKVALEPDLMETYHLYQNHYGGNLTFSEFASFWEEMNTEERMCLVGQFQAGRPYLNNPLTIGKSLHPLMRLRILELVY